MSVGRFFDHMSRGPSNSLHPRTRKRREKWNRNLGRKQTLGGEAVVCSLRQPSGFVGPDLNPCRVEGFPWRRSRSSSSWATRASVRRRPRRRTSSAYRSSPHRFSPRSESTTLATRRIVLTKSGEGLRPRREAGKSLLTSAMRTPDVQPAARARRDLFFALGIRQGQQGPVMSEREAVHEVGRKEIQLMADTDEVVERGVAEEQIVAGGQGAEALLLGAAGVGEALVVSVEEVVGEARICLQTPSQALNAVRHRSWGFAGQGRDLRRLQQSQNSTKRTSTPAAAGRPSALRRPLKRLGGSSRQSASDRASDRDCPQSHLGGEATPIPVAEGWRSFGEPLLSIR